MHYAKYFLILFGLGFAGASHAQIYAARCSGCSDTEFEQKARYMGVGRHYLYDFAGNDIRRYEVVDARRGNRSTPAASGSAMRPPGNDAWLIYQITVQPEIQEAFDATLPVWILNGGALGSVQAPVTIDPTAPGLPWQLRDSSAWHIAMMPNRQNILEQYIKSHYVDIQGMSTRWDTIVKAISDLLQNAATGSLAGVIFGSDPISVTYVVTLPYGGTVRITYDHTHDGNLWYRQGESKDGNENPIPENPDDLAWNVYGFGADPSAFDQWNNNPWGIPWPDDFCTVVACVIVGDPAGRSLEDALNDMDNGQDEELSTQQQQGISCSCAAM